MCTSGTVKASGGRAIRGTDFLAVVFRLNAFSHKGIATEALMDLTEIHNHEAWQSTQICWMCPAEAKPSFWQNRRR
jgi:hypothetical protein